MRKVTRTVVKGVIRYKVNGEQKVMVVENVASDTVDLVMQIADNDSIELGYAPVLYSMSEVDFMEKASTSTNLATCHLYSDKESCPKTADRKVGGGDNT